MRNSRRLSGARRLRGNEETAVVVGDRMLACWPSADTALRNMSAVTLTELGLPGREVAEIVELTPVYVSMLRTRARTEGGLTRSRGRRPKLDDAVLARVRSWRRDGMTNTEIARRLGVHASTIGRALERADASAAAPHRTARRPVGTAGAMLLHGFLGRVGLGPVLRAAGTPEHRCAAEAAGLAAAALETALRRTTGHVRLSASPLGLHRYLAEAMLRADAGAPLAYRTGRNLIPRQAAQPLLGTVPPPTAGEVILCCFRDVTSATFRLPAVAAVRMRALNTVAPTLVAIDTPHPPPGLLAQCRDLGLDWIVRTPDRDVDLRTLGRGASRRIDGPAGVLVTSDTNLPATALSGWLTRHGRVDPPSEPAPGPGGMLVRLLAANARQWLGEHLGAYGVVPSARALDTVLRLRGRIRATATEIRVGIEPHPDPPLDRAVGLLLQELNTTPLHLPADPRPLTYHRTY